MLTFLPLEFSMKVRFLRGIIFSQIALGIVFLINLIHKSVARYCQIPSIENKLENLIAVENTVSACFDSNRLDRDMVDDAEYLSTVFNCQAKSFSSSSTGQIWQKLESTIESFKEGFLVEFDRIDSDNPNCEFRDTCKEQSLVVEDLFKRIIEPIVNIALDSGFINQSIRFIFWTLVGSEYSVFNIFAIAQNAGCDFVDLVHSIYQKVTF